MSTATTLQLDPVRRVDAAVARSARMYYGTKRVFDCVAATMLVVIAFPLWIVLVVLIRLDSKGPALFKQQRVGSRRVVENGGTSWELVTFTFYKFRTMYVDEHEPAHRVYMTAYINNDIEYFSSRTGGYADGESFRLRDDPRVTRIGRVLRKLSLDELPQLLNVLRGEMSMVGPRPPMPYEVALYNDAQLQRLTARGGVTGWAQVNGRCTIGFDDVVRLDAEYARRQSFLFDLWILLRTVPAVLSRRGAD